MSIHHSVADGNCFIQIELNLPTSCSTALLFPPAAITVRLPGNQLRLERVSGPGQEEVQHVTGLNHKYVTCEPGLALHAKLTTSVYSLDIKFTLADINRPCLNEGSGELMDAGCSCGATQP